MMEEGMRFVAQWVGRRVRAPMVAAAAALCGGLGVYLAPDLFAPPEPTGAFVPARPSLNSAPRAEPETPEPQAAVGQPLTLDQFIGALKKAAGPKTAKQVGEAFLSVPALRQEYAGFEKKRGGGAPAREFIGRLGGHAEFASLVSRFRSDPGFRQAFASATADPRVERALRGVAGTDGEGAGGAAAASSAGARFRRAALTRSGGVGSMSGIMRQRMSTAYAGAGAAAPIPPSGVASTGFQASAVDGGAVPATGVPGDSPHPRRLAAVPVVDATRNAGCTARSLFAAAPKSLRDTLQAECDDKGICDPAQACETAAVMDRCWAVANSKPGCNAVFSEALARLAAEAGDQDGGGTTGPGDASSGQVGDLKPDDPSNKLKTGDTPAPGADTKTAGTDPWVTGGRIVGAVVGGAVGAVIGGVIGGPVGAVIGGVVGGVIGGVIGGIAGPVVHGLLTWIGF